MICLKHKKNQSVIYIKTKTKIKFILRKQKNIKLMIMMKILRLNNSI